MLTVNLPNKTMTSPEPLPKSLPNGNRALTCQRYTAAVPTLRAKDQADNQDASARPGVALKQRADSNITPATGNMTGHKPASNSSTIYECTHCN